MKLLRDDGKHTCQPLQNMLEHTSTVHYGIRFLMDEARKNNLLQIKEVFHILLAEQKRLQKSMDYGTNMAGCWMSLLRSKLCGHRYPSVQNAGIQADPSGVTSMRAS